MTIIGVSHLSRRPSARSPFQLPLSTGMPPVETVCRNALIPMHVQVTLPPEQPRSVTLQSLSHLPLPARRQHHLPLLLRLPLLLLSTQHPGSFTPPLLPLLLRLQLSTQRRGSCIPLRLLLPQLLLLLLYTQRRGSCTRLCAVYALHPICGAC